MPEEQPWSNIHVTSMVVTVSYSHDSEAWRATYQVFQRDDGHETIPLGAGRTEFGPFDSYIEVGYWLAGLSKQLKTMAAERKPADRQDSPAGNDDGPLSRGGR